MTSRLRCASSGCIGYFTPKHTLDTLCPECIAKEADKARGEILQDNGDAAPYVSPDSALTLVQCRIELARTREELTRWRAFGMSNYATIAAVAAPRQLLGNRIKLATSQVNINHSDFPEIMDEIEGPAYRRQG